VKDGGDSVQLGVEGVKDCAGGGCSTHSPCEESFHWPEQDTRDDPRCNLTQSDGRLQASHSVGLIYVYPHGPQLREGHPEFDAKSAHQRSARLSAEEVRDTFKNRMGWTDRETVALVGGGHTLGRAHGNCAAKEDPALECIGQFTTTAGYEGAWTRTPSRWNYDYFQAMLDGTKWVPTKSPEGNDQWGTEGGPWAGTLRLTADLAMVQDVEYRKWAEKYNEDHALFDSDFADAWFKLVHRSKEHPKDGDLEVDMRTCTTLDFAAERVEL